MESVLTSIKKLLGITQEDEYFDADIIIHINSVFMILNQIGVGPSKIFYIKDKNDVWNDFLPDGDIEAVKSFVYLKVKLLFDPPNNSSLIESTNRLLSELEWRMNVEVENRDA